MTDASLCDPINVVMDTAWVQRGFMNIHMSGDALTRDYDKKDYIEVQFSKPVGFQAVWNPLKTNVDRVEHLGSDSYRFFFFQFFEGYTAPSFLEVPIAQLTYQGNANNYPQILAAQICPEEALTAGIILKNI